MLETDDRVRGIIYRAPGVRDQEFCMSHKNGLHFGQGNSTYRFPCAPMDRHLVKLKSCYVYHVFWLTQGREYCSCN